MQNIWKNAFVLCFLTFLLSFPQSQVTPAGLNVWMTNGPEGGLINTLAIDPYNPSILYAGTMGGGVFKSTDDGESWSLANTGMTNKYIQVLAIDPNNPTTIYAGTMDTPVFTVPTGGVFKSTDSGVSWILLNNGLSVRDVRSLVIDPNNPNILYAGTGWGGVFKTTNAGTSWSAINSGLTNITIQALVIDPQSTNIVYAGTWAGVFKTINSGESWSPMNTGLTNVQVQALVIDSQSPSILFAGTYYGGGVVFKSTNGGGSWNPFNIGLPETQVYTLAIDPTNSATIYVGTKDGGGMFKSVNAGGSWTPANNGMISNNTVRAIAINFQAATTIYAGTWGGVFKSINGGGSWSEKINGLFAADIRTLAIDPIMPTTIYAGTDGGVFKSINGGGSWSAINSGLTYSDVYDLAINPQTPTTLYAGTWSGGVFKSTDSGGSWTAMNSGLTRINVEALAIDPQTPSTIYAGTWYSGGVFKSTDSGGSWIPINNGLTQADVGTLAIDPVSPNTIYAGTRDGVFRSVDGGMHWNAVNTGINGLQVVDLVIDPLTPAIIYASSFHNGTYYYDNLFKSTNSGESWKAINSGLPRNMWFAHMAIDPKSPNIIYAGIYNGGVFKSMNGGGIWNPMNNGLTNTFVSDLVIDPKNPTTLYAGTEGSGVFTYTGSALSISQIEVNQGLGKPQGEAQLFVAGKDTAIRVFLNSPVYSYQLYQQVEVKRDGTLVATLKPQMESQSTDVLTFLCDRTTCNSWQEGNYTVEATINGVTNQISAIFQMQKTIRILAIPVRVKVNGEVQLPDETWKTAHFFLNKVYPLGFTNVDWVEGSTLDATFLNLNNKTDRIKLILMLSAMQIPQCGLPFFPACYDEIVGFIPDICVSGESCQAGWTHPWFKSVTAVMTRKDVQAILAHEIGHYYELGDEYNLCDAQNQCEINPPPKDYLGSPWGGGDCENQCPKSDAVAWNGPQGFATGSTVVADIDHPFDVVGKGSLPDMLSFMGSGGKQDNYWITPDIYNHIYNETMQTRSLEQFSTSLSRLIYASGWIGQDDSISIESWYTYTDTLPATITGTFTIQAVDALSNTLASQGFDVSYYLLSDPPELLDPTIFQVLAPFPQDTVAFRIKHGDTTLKVIPVSPHAPEVSVVYPNGDESWGADETHIVSWTGSDADGDALTYSILYTPDSINWITLGTLITSTQLSINTGQIPGGDSAGMEVIATDGINAGSDISNGVFSVGKKAPQAYILSPDDNMTLRYDRSFFLHGYAYDLEDSTLADSAFQWSSDKDGYLGEGKLILVDLSYGNHIISLTVADSDSNTSTVSIYIFVGNRIFLPLTMKK